MREAAAEIDAREAAEANARVNLDDSDDDVQIVAASFDPKVAEKHKAAAQKAAIERQVQQQSHSVPIIKPG